MAITSTDVRGATAHTEATVKDDAAQTPANRLPDIFNIRAQVASELTGGLDTFVDWIAAQLEVCEEVVSDTPHDSATVEDETYQKLSRLAALTERAARLLEHVAGEPTLVAVVANDGSAVVGNDGDPVVASRQTDQSDESSNHSDHLKTDDEKGAHRAHLKTAEQYTSQYSVAVGSDIIGESLTLSEAGQLADEHDGASVVAPKKSSSTHAEVHPMEVDDMFQDFANGDIQTEHLGDSRACQREIDDGRAEQDAMGHLVRAYLPHYVEFDYLLDDRDERTLAEQLACHVDDIDEDYYRLANRLRGHNETSDEFVERKIAEMEERQGHPMPERREGQQAVAVFRDEKFHRFVYIPDARSAFVRNYNELSGSSGLEARAC